MKYLYGSVTLNDYMFPLNPESVKNTRHAKPMLKLNMNRKSINLAKILFEAGARLYLSLFESKLFPLANMFYFILNNFFNS